MARPPRRQITSLKDLPLDQPVLVSDFARACHMRTQHALRLLKREHRKHDEPVLMRIGAPTTRSLWYITSLNRLRQVWSGIGERGLTVEELTEQLEASREREAGLLDRHRETEKQVVGVRARTRSLEDRVAKAEEALVKAIDGIEALHGELKAFREQSRAWFRGERARAGGDDDQCT